jgi:hypothetical protein
MTRSYDHVMQNSKVHTLYEGILYSGFSPLSLQQLLLKEAWTEVAYSHNMSIRITIKR